MNIGIEDEFVEFKESWSEKEAAMDDISAILNKHRRGTVYFGVKNSGEIIGLKVSNKTAGEIAQKINQTLEPVPFYSINVKNTTEGLSFIQVSFEGEDVPYRSHGRYFIRNGDRADIMPTSFLHDYFLSIEKNYSVWEGKPSDCTIEDIDEERLKKVIASGNENHRIIHPYQGVKDALSFFHLLSPNGSVSNAGKYLFGKNEVIPVRLATLAGNDKTVYKDMSREYGNIFDLIDISLTYISARLNVAPILTEGKTTRKMVSEIPFSALREIIVNAFGHANYSLPLEHEINVYNNRVSVFNPGVFPLDYTPEQFAEKSADPVDRNTKIAKVLYAANYIEHFGTGFTTIFREFSQNLISYHYEGRRAGFLFETYRKVPFIYNPEMSEYQNLLELLKSNSYIKIQDMAITLKKSKPTISRMLKQLVENGSLTRVGNTKTGRWYVK